MGFKTNPFKTNVFKTNPFKTILRHLKVPNPNLLFIVRHDVCDQIEIG